MERVPFSMARMLDDVGVANEGSFTNSIIKN